MTKTTNFKFLGKPRKLVEGAEKVTGHIRYTADINLPGMLHARPILSPYAHATIIKIDKRAAEAMPGVVAVLAAQDLPTKDKPITSRNSAILAKGKVLWRGQPVLVVVAESEAIATDAIEAVLIEYDPLSAIVDLEAAIAPNAPLVWENGLPSSESDLSSAHANVEKSESDATEALPPNVHDHSHFGWGDVNVGFSQAAVLAEHSYRTPMVHQAYLEPHACIANPDPLGRSITIHTATQGAYLVRDEVAKLLSLPVSKVNIVPEAFGGGFGAKYGILEPLVGAIAMTLKRPVRMVYSRSDDFLATTPAHGMLIKLKTGAKADGTLCALQAEIYLDNGVFPFAVGSIAGTLIGGYYKCEHVSIDMYEVNTHKPQAGAYRAPSAPQVTFALESNMDEMAHQLGINPFAFRWQNRVETGDKAGNGTPWPDIGLTAVLETFRQHPAWKNRQKGANEGIGIAVGGWPAFMGPAAAICRVDTDGTVSVQTGAVDISGINSSFVLVAAEMLGVHPDAVEIISADTQMGPYAPNSGGSQVTYSVAGAISDAAADAKQKLLQIASDEFEASPDDIELLDGKAQVRGVPDRQIEIGKLVQVGRSKAGGVGPIIGEGHKAQPENAPGFVIHMVKVVVDPDTYEITPLDYVAVQDVGFALNPLMVEGQMHGGAIQGLGMGLYEALVYDEEGQLLTGSFMDYTMPRIDTVPNVEAVLVEHPSPHGPFGARGVGEPPITAGAAALANAVYDATGVRLTTLPIRAEDLWRAKNLAIND